MTDSVANSQTIVMTVFVAGLMAAYVWARWVRSDWSLGRDVAMLSWIAILGGFVIYLLNGPEFVVPILLPIVLIAGGAYGVLASQAPHSQLHSASAWLALVAGLGWLVIGAIRFALF